MRFYRGSNCYLRTNPRANLHQKSAPPLESDGGADEASLTLRRFQLRANFSDTGSRPSPPARSGPVCAFSAVGCSSGALRSTGAACPAGAGGASAGLVTAITAVAAGRVSAATRAGDTRGATLATVAPITVAGAVAAVAAVTGLRVSGGVSALERR